MKIKKSPNPLFNECKELISLYLTKGDKISWPKEIKIAKKLLASYPIEFFRQYDPLTKFYSLAVFLTKAGKLELKKNFDIYNLTKPCPQVKLEDKPVVQLEQSVTEKTPKTLQEFVDEKE